MADLVRERHDLLVLRLSLDLQPPARVRFELWRGREALGQQEMESRAIGLPEHPSFEAYRRAQFTLRDDLRGWIRETYDKERREPGEPLWLNLEDSCGHLPIVPWEELLLGSVSGSILRVPHFLVSPRFPEGDSLRLAVCASSPLAKSSFDVSAYVADSVRTLQTAGLASTETHIFADAEAYAELRGRALASTAEHTVLVHDPAEAESYGLGASSSGSGLDDSKVTSPWLRWMLRGLADKAADAVHFACPGFFSDAFGALAMARSPLHNSDPDRSHFIGARELATFLNRAGALSVGLSQPNETIWNYGLRLLADQLARLRPGPVLLHQDPSTDLPVGHVYGFLFAPNPPPLPRIPKLALYVHPQRLAKRYEVVETDSFSWPMPQQATFAASRYTTPFAAGAPAPLSRYALSAPPREVIAPEKPLWERSIQLEVDQALAELASSGSNESRPGSAREGASRAVDLIQSLLGKGDPS